MLLDKNAKFTMRQLKSHLSHLLQLGVKSAVVTYDECKVQVMCLVI